MLCCGLGTWEGFICPVSIQMFVSLHIWSISWYTSGAVKLPNKMFLYILDAYWKIVLQETEPFILPSAAYLSVHFITSWPTLPTIILLHTCHFDRWKIGPFVLIIRGINLFLSCELCIPVCCLIILKFNNDVCYSIFK